MTGRPKKSTTVLAVDDSVTYRHALSDLLDARGYETIIAASGEEALSILSSRHVDCVLLDLMMPGLSGVDTCRRIKEDGEVRTIPVLMLTAHEGREMMVTALRAGADDFVTKADDFEVLEARVRAHVRRRRFEEENRRIREELLNARHAASQAQAEKELADTRARLLDDLETKNTELLRAKEDAEAGVRARDEFLTIASHELRTPLTSLSLHLQRIRRTLGAQPMECVPQTFATGIDVATRQTTRLAALIDALLDASRMSAGRLELRLETLDLAAAVRASVDAIASFAEQAGSTLVLRVSGPVVGRWDRARCQQVTHNLLSNAIRYGEGKPIEVEIGKVGEVARLSVRDHGIGISEDHRARIFGIFERAVPSRNYGGLGLGLYITKQIVDAMGGSIAVKSAVGEGSEFVVDLPLQSASGAEAA